MRAAWLLFVVALPACAGPEPRSADDALLFELPEWCGKGRRQGWTSWDAARKSRPTGSAICGVRLPSGGDDGVCVVIRDGRVAAAVVRSAGEQRAEGELASLEVSRGWAIVESLPETLVRVDGETLKVRNSKGEAEGPCFHGATATVASFGGETKVRPIK